VNGHDQRTCVCVIQGQIFRRRLQLFFGLSFLPANEVADAFTDDIMPDAPASDTAMKFADYVLKNYIAVDSNFPPTLWAHPPDFLMPHTNNGAESYHSHLNAEFYAKHPNIYIRTPLAYMFVDVLKKIQQSASVSVNSLSQPFEL